MSQDQNYDYNSLFNPQVKMGAEKKSNVEEYAPTAAKGKNKIYQSLIRFIPYWPDPENKSIMEKWTCWLVDPLTQKGKSVDCPSSIGRKDSPLQEMYFKFKKSDSVLEQSKAEIFSRRHAFASLVQVIKDENDPTLEGKILVLRYGKKLWEKLNAEKKPLIGQPHEPFDLLKGKIFALIITEQTVEDKKGNKRVYNNYDQSKFLDKSVGLCIPNEQGKLIPINEKSEKSVVLEYLKTNSLDLAKYGFKEWDQETHDYVNSVILQVSGQAQSSQNYASVQQSVKETKAPAAQQSKPIVQPQAKSTTGISTSDLNLDDLDNLGSVSSIDIPDLGLGGDLQDALAGL